MKGRVYPVAYGKHVIVDTRDESLHEVVCHSAHEAMCMFLTTRSMDEIDAMDKNHRDDAMGFMIRTTLGKAIGNAPRFPDGIIRAGPYETQDYCQGQLDMLCFVQRFYELVGDQDNPSLRDTEMALKAREMAHEFQTALKIEEIPEHMVIEVKPGEDPFAAIQRAINELKGKM